MNFSSEENIFSVSEINRHLKNVIETNIPDLFVEGEIANFTRHFSGHIYLSLKDENATLRCVFFKTWNSYLDFSPKNGDKVICTGKLTVYEKSGNYQMNITRMYPTGMGDLQIRFEELKRRLQEDGLFDQAHKKVLPRYPETIGVITSATGAAIEDIRNVISRRWGCEIRLYPALVQGNGAPKSLIGGIEYFTRNPVDVIVIGRGGGSQEDLFVFNDEMLARTIYDCPVPIISAVGHEIDFTICDFVADLRAPTPSAAAELAVPDRNEVLGFVSSHARHIEMQLQNHLNRLHRTVETLQYNIERNSPYARLQAHQQQLDEATYRLLQTIRLIDRKKLQTERIQQRFFSAVSSLTADYCKDCRYRLKTAGRKLSDTTERILERKQNHLATQSALLEDLSPKVVIKRGYSITRKAGQIIRSAKHAQKNDKLEVELHDGSLNCTVDDVILR